MRHLLPLRGTAKDAQNGQSFFVTLLCLKYTERNDHFMHFDSYGDYVFYDGAMGTMLQEYGLKPGQRPDILNLTKPEAVETVHRMYVDAGSQIICANTFGANAKALHGQGCTPGEIINAAIAIARRASRGTAKVALDIGPLGLLIEPMGDLDFDEAYDLFKEQAIAGENAGADFAAIETMSDITELKAAMLAITENTGLPVLATMTFDKTGRTFIGCRPEDFAETAQELGAAAAGINCSLEPSEMIGTVKRIAGATSLPLIIKPNAGLPDSHTGLYSVNPAEFADQMALLINSVREAEGSTGPNGSTPRRRMIIGGCCGTTPDYIRELRKKFDI